MKKNEILPFATKWMQLKNIIFIDINVLQCKKINIRFVVTNVV